jgi:hypothetical protein
MVKVLIYRAMKFHPISRLVAVGIAIKGVDDDRAPRRFQGVFPSGSYDPRAAGREWVFASGKTSRVRLRRTLLVHRSAVI